VSDKTGGLVRLFEISSSGGEIYFRRIILVLA
jgi:hypothetical protein